MAELMTGQPLFPGDSGVDQLVEIIKVLGTPTREQILAMNKSYTEFKFPQIKANPWNRVCPFGFVVQGQGQPLKKGMSLWWVCCTRPRQPLVIDYVFDI
jgi:hypothetical protein